MRNPLNKRLLRDLKSEMGKYMVIFILLFASISLICGFLVADGSMLKAYDDSFTDYNIEDGHFKVVDKPNKSQLKAIDDFGIDLYENFYVEKNLDNGSKLRIFKNRDQVNQICVMSGRLPEKVGEIALDRMYASNNKIKIGDVVTSGTKSWTVTGLVAFSDYSALYENNSDSMFDSIKFGIGCVCEKEFDSFDEDELNYCYSWKYEGKSAWDLDDGEEKEISDDLMEDLQTEITLDDFVPQYLNQAITFTGEDMGSDKAMMIVLLYIIIAIIAFVFVVTTLNTIIKESTIIGTLRALGYTKGELLRHYMIMPLLVSVVAALLGNILGYTYMTAFCAGLYYNSYSLPTYTTIFNGEAFVLTTVVPLLIIIAITGIILFRKLKISPLKFMRRDFSKNRKGKAFPLPKVIPFMARFRIRVIIQNLGNYLLLFMGILFAEVLLLFGLVFPSMLTHYEEDMKNSMFCKYQYILQMPISDVSHKSELEDFFSMVVFGMEVDTDNEDAEKFSVESLETCKEGCRVEDISVYGIDKDSKYLPFDFSGHKIYVTNSILNKYKLKVGDTLTLKEKYKDKYYDFKIGGTYDYPGSLSVYMSMEDYNEMFDQDDDYYCGYFSDSEITDIDSKYISSIIDEETLTKISRQLDHSMGDMMYIVDVFAVLIFIVLMYIISKTVIEKNTQSISMTKILGYNNGEIAGLYIVSTTVVTIISIFVSLPLVSKMVKALFEWMFLNEMPGWIDYYQNPSINVEMIALGIITYIGVAVFEWVKIKKIPMDLALKNVE